MFNRIVLKMGLAFVAVIGFGVAVAMAGPAPLGSLVGSRNAILDGQLPLPHTTILSGDNLKVNNGVAMVSLNRGNRVTLGKGTDATFSQESKGVTVALARGNMALYHSRSGTALRVKIGDVTVAPAKGSRAFGELAMADGLLVVTAKDGALQVEKDGKAEDVSKGKTVTLATAAASHSPSAPRAILHVKHVASGRHRKILYLGIAGGAGAVAGFLVVSQTPRQVSPYAP